MKKALSRYIMLSLTVILLGMAAGSCSLKKNTAASRKYSAFITRYNIYYNGDTHYKETLEDMERKYEDDFSQTLYVHPAEARQNDKAPQPTGDFTRSIEKAQKAIQVRSIKARPPKKPGRNDAEYKEWMRRDEYNPFLHNAWMMMGRSQFLNGDFLGAASTFFYISKHFTWLPATVTEARIWQARSYIAIDWLFEAEMILTRIKPDQLVNRDIDHLYNLTFADYYIKAGDNVKAIPYLQKAIKTANTQQKIRLNFLLGQIYALAGNKSDAYKAFESAGKSPSAPYRTKFNARIKQSEVFEGSDIQPEINALKRMTRYDRNKPYLDQIYYAIGNLYLSRRDTAQAIENYELAVEKSTRSGIDKALVQLALGGLYYDKGRYEDAQPCYAEAMPLIPENRPDYKALKKRSDFLDELAVYSQNVTLQDSLLRLSYMTPEQQKKVAEKLIEELKKKEAEEEEQRRKEEYMASKGQFDNSSQGSGPAPSTFTMNADNSWYFYNPSTVTAGKTEFQRRWGSRKLEDDWRRRNKASFAFNTTPEADDDAGATEEGADAETAESEETAEERTAREHENDPHFVEYYLKQIPKDDNDRQVANDVIQEGYYNMGVILKDKLEDFNASQNEFEKLLHRYPDNIYRLDTYYNMYLMSVRANKPAQAERYRQLILSEFPDSPYAQAMQDPNYIENLRRMDYQQQALYDFAYEAYLANRNSEVHRAYERMKQEFPMSKIMPKFMFLDALAYVTEERPDEFKSVLTEMLERYPNTDLTPYAASYIKGLNSGRKLHSGVANMRGMLWDTRLSNDTTAVAPDGEPIFTLAPQAPQLLILLFPTDSVSSNQLLYNVARHNFSTFTTADYDLEQMNFGRLGLLIVKPFANEDAVNRYRSAMTASTTLELPEQVRPVTISVDNFDALLKSGSSFESYFRFIDDQTYQGAQTDVLPPDEFGEPETLDEAEKAAEVEGEGEIDGETEGVEAPIEEVTFEIEPEVSAPATPAEPTTEQSSADAAIDAILRNTVAPTERIAEQAEEPEIKSEIEQIIDSGASEEQEEALEPEAPAEAEPENSEDSEISEPSESEAEAPAEPEVTVAEPELEAPAEPEPEQVAPENVKEEPEPARPTVREPYYPAGSEGDDPLFDNP